MALSNIWREPRREITETLLGLTVVGGWLYADYGFAAYIQRCPKWNDGSSGPCPIILGMLMGFLFTVAIPLIGALLVLIGLGIHELGENIANSLARRGLELRPKMRYR